MDDNEALTLETVRDKAGTLVYDLQPAIDHFEANPGPCQMDGTPLAKFFTEIQTTLDGIYRVLSKLKGFGGTLGQKELGVLYGSVYEAEQELENFREYKTSHPERFPPPPPPAPLRSAPLLAVKIPF